MFIEKEEEKLLKKQILETTKLLALLTFNLGDKFQIEIANKIVNLIFPKNLELCDLSLNPFFKKIITIEENKIAQNIQNAIIEYDKSSRVKQENRFKNIK